MGTMKLMERGWYLYDLGSTHGTSVNKRGIEPHNYHRLRVGDQIGFAASTRRYLLCGPDWDRPPELPLPHSTQGPSWTMWRSSPSTSSSRPRNPFEPSCPDAPMPPCWRVETVKKWVAEIGTHEGMVELVEFPACCTILTPHSSLRYVSSLALMKKKKDLLDLHSLLL